MRNEALPFETGRDAMLGVRPRRAWHSRACGTREEAGLAVLLQRGKSRIQRSLSLVSSITLKNLQTFLFRFVKVFFFILILFFVSPCSIPVTSVSRNFSQPKYILILFLNRMKKCCTHAIVIFLKL